MAGGVVNYAVGAINTNLATTIFAFFSDDGTVTPATTNVFQSTFTTAENPSFANRLVLGSVTSGVVSTGVVDAADAVFTGASVLTGATSVESLHVAKFITNAAASPMLVHFDTATGLPLTPNGADVTVVWNSSGIWKY
jgi:hypothetical protein